MKSRSLRGLSLNNQIFKQFGIFLVILCVVVSCTKKPNTKHTVKVTQTTPVASAKNTPVITPERSAAQNLAKDGITAVTNKQNDKAIDLFQEAISVDPSYGVSYLELAKIKLASGNLEESQNLLEKATSLLSHEPDWELVWKPAIEAFKATFPANL